MSVCTSAMLAARIAVNAPMEATTVEVIGVSSKSAEAKECGGECPQFQPVPPDNTANERAQRLPLPSPA